MSGALKAHPDLLRSFSGAQRNGLKRNLLVVAVWYKRLNASTFIDESWDENNLYRFKIKYTYIKSGLTTRTLFSRRFLLYFSQCTHSRSNKKSSCLSILLKIFVSQTVEDCRFRGKLDSSFLYNYLFKTTTYILYQILLSCTLRHKKIKNITFLDEVFCYPYRMFSSNLSMLIFVYAIYNI